MVDIENKTVSVQVVARLLDLSPRRVNQLCIDGVIPKAAHGKYELLPALHGYIKNQRRLLLSYRSKKYRDPEDFELEDLILDFGELNP